MNKECELYAKMFSKQKLEQDFRELVKRNTLKEEVDEILELTFNKVWSEEVQRLKASKIAKIHERETREQEIRELVDMARQTRSDTLRSQYEHRIEELAIELENVQERQQGDLTIPFRTAFHKATEMLKNPITIWDSVDAVEKHRLFFVLFDDRLEYSENEAFRTADSLSATRIFQQFSQANYFEVDIVEKSSNSLKKYLRRFWEYHQASSILQKSLLQFSAN